MSAVYIAVWLGAATLAGHLLVKWHDAIRTDNAIHEWLDATTQLSDDGSDQ